MKKKRLIIRIIVIVIVVLETLVLAGCGMINNSADVNSSYDAIKTAYGNNPSNSEISFIYDAINNQISEYPSTVPDFINLPIECLMDAIDEDESINISYANDEQYQNGIIIAQEPEAGAVWGEDKIVNLTVNRKYSDINSHWGYMSESLGVLYLIYNTDSSRDTSIIWSDGEKLVEDEVVKIYANHGDVYYSDRQGVNKLEGESVSQVLAEDTLTFVIHNDKIYYIEECKLRCYDLNSRTDSVITDESVMLFNVNSDYIMCWGPNDIYVLDNKSHNVIKTIHSEDGLVGCYMDKDNVYFIQMQYISTFEQVAKIVKYNITRDEQTTVFESDELATDILAIDDKIIFIHAVDNQLVIRYIDMRNMEDKYFALENEDIADILFDGQRIIYKTREEVFYSISIFTGETKKIEFK